jgi:hypothetical protein
VCKGCIPLSSYEYPYSWPRMSTSRRGICRFRCTVKPPDVTPRVAKRKEGGQSQASKDSSPAGLHSRSMTLGEIGKPSCFVFFLNHFSFPTGIAPQCAVRNKPLESYFAGFPADSCYCTGKGSAHHLARSLHQPDATPPDYLPATGTPKLTDNSIITKLEYRTGRGHWRGIEQRQLNPRFRSCSPLSPQVRLHPLFRILDFARTRWSGPSWPCPDVPTVYWIRDITFETLDQLGRPVLRSSSINWQG